MKQIPFRAPTGAQIRAGRKRHKLTQSKAAALIRVSLRTWASWEAGEAEISFAAWYCFTHLCDELG